MKKNLSGTVLMYTIFLVAIAMVMALVILNLSTEIFNNNETQNIMRSLSRNITYKADISFKYDKFLNMNGTGTEGGFGDNTSCPTSINMVGTTFSGTVASSLIATGGRLECTGTYNGTGFRVVWSDDYTGFSGAYLQDYSVAFPGGVPSGVFSDPDSTYISFSPLGLGGIDGIDDDMNSDNYTVTSTGNIYYPNGAEDDDALARKRIYFYLPPGGGFTNVFWSNKKYRDYIGANTNNIDLLNKPLGQVGSGVLYFDIDKSFRLKVVKFDKDKYNVYNELEPLEVYNSPTMFGRLGYIQNDGTISTGGLVKTGNEMVFDFTNNDYAVFLSNSSTGTLFFSLKGYTTEGSGVYINSIDDDNQVETKYLGNDIIIDSEGRYLKEQFEVVDVKYAKYIHPSTGTGGGGCPVGFFNVGYCFY